jgi:oligo-alginate lyase
LKLTIDTEGLSRRALLKLMALASPGLLGARIVAAAVPEQTPATMGARSASGHPRLFYTADSLKQIRRMLEADQATNAALQQKGEALLNAEFIPETVAEIGGGQQANYIAPATQISDMGLTLGLLFQLTGEEKYAVKLRDALLYYGNYVRWAGPQLIERNPPWHSELDTTTFSFGYAAGYDALRGFLSERDRQTIAAAMIRLGLEPTLNDWILPGKRIHSFDSMGHNWWGVCVAGGGLCALALLGDDPRAQSWIDAIDAGYVQWFSYAGNVLQNRMRTFEQSGPSYEGVGYTNYGVSEYLRYRFAWQNTFPDQKWPRLEPLEHVASYLLETLYPTSSGFLTVNFEDGAIGADSTATMLLLIACGIATPETARYLELVRNQPQDKSNDTLLNLLRQYPQPAAMQNPPTSCIYPHMGWAILRDSWQPDATMLAMKSGYTWNHAHADAGNFILFKQGKPLIIDSGTCSYSRPEYRSYYRTSRAHNVILFDGQGQPPDDIGLGCKFPGRMHTLIDGQGLKYVYADATGPMARWFNRNYRHWIWSGDLILIVDDVRAHAPGQMDWLLHYAGESTPEGSGSVRLSNGPAEASVKMLYPASTISTEMGLADHNPDEKIPYLVFHPDGPAQNPAQSPVLTRQFITAICLNPSATPAFSVQEDPDYLHVQITTQDATEDLYLSRRAIATPGTMCINAGGFTTDAYLLHARRAASESQPDRYLVADGSYLRRGGLALMESLSKRTVCWAPGESLEVFSDDQAAPLAIGTAQRPQNVNHNGQAATAAYDDHEKLTVLKF